MPTTNITGLATIVLGLGLSLNAAAQDVATTTTTTTPTITVTGSNAPADIPGAYDTLPPGEKSIANALYEAQPKPVAVGTQGDGTTVVTGPTYWTRDQIATAKLSGSGWGEIFHEMKRDGLVTEKSLGQVIRRDVFRPRPQAFRENTAPSSHHHGDGLHPAFRHEYGQHEYGRPEVTVTTATGATRSVGLGYTHHRSGEVVATASAGTFHGNPGASHVTGLVTGGGVAAGSYAASSHGNGNSGHGHAR